MSKAPASKMLRVPSVLIPAVKEISRLHREGHTQRILGGLQDLLSDLDSNFDSSSEDVDIKSDSKADITELLNDVLGRLKVLEAKVFDADSKPDISTLSNVGKEMSLQEICSKYGLSSKNFARNRDKAGLTDIAYLEQKTGKSWVKVGHRFKPLDAQ